jgi:hypothetical protein
LNLIPWVVGGPALEPAARLLLEFLDKDPDRWVVAPHFGGVASPVLLDHPGPVRDLFSHPRLLVIFSRYSAYDPQMVKEWAVALVEKLGWERILYGSEFPVCLWRNETYANTMEWVKSLGIDINEDAFYGGNALRCLWRHPIHSPQLVDRSLYPAVLNTAGSIHLFPHQGLVLPEAVHRQLIERYWAEQDRYPDYRSFIAHILIEWAVR